MDQSRPNLMPRLTVIALNGDIPDANTFTTLEQCRQLGATIIQLWISSAWEINPHLTDVLDNDSDCVILLDTRVQVNPLDLHTLHLAALNEKHPVSAITALDEHRIAVDKRWAGWDVPIRCLAISKDTLFDGIARGPDYLSKVEQGGRQVIPFFQAIAHNNNREFLEPSSFFCWLWNGVTLAGRPLGIVKAARVFPNQRAYQRLFGEQTDKE